MSDTLSDFAQQFGWCPECGQECPYLNLGRDHWFYCDAHRVRWRGGSNVFSSWLHEDEATWACNLALIWPYREVDSHTPTPEMLGRALKRVT